MTNSYGVLSEKEENEPPDKGGEPGAAQLVSASSGVSRNSTIVTCGELDEVQCVDMLIDTGASCCFVRRSWAVNSGLSIVEVKQHITVTLADERTTVCTRCR